jgi:hypothetical protein
MQRRRTAAGARRTFTFVVWLTAIFTCAVCAAQSKPNEFTVAEKWTAAQVAAGEIADLDKQFSNEVDRKLSARLLGDLLSSTSAPAVLQRNGVRINGAIFDETIDLSNARIPCDVWLTCCEFRKAVTFARTTFAGVAMFDRSTFKAEANFDSVKVGHIAFFREVTFEALANFASANIGWQLWAKGAHFENAKAGAIFNGVKVGQIAFFQGATFNGPVDFQVADIANNFEADGTQFTNKSETVRFNMKCGRKGFFWGARFAGPVSFLDSSFSDLFIGDDLKSSGGSISQIDLSRCAVKRQLVIQNTTIQDLIAPSMHVEGPASFKNITVTNSADLSFGDFTTLDLSRSVWPRDPNHFHMQGMSYKYAGADPDERQSHGKLLKLASQSAFTADVYHNLEELFSRQGYRADADKAFIAGKRREREQYFRSGEWLRWLGSWMLDLLVGYGRRPWKAGILCAFLVAFGCIVFSREKMELQETEDGRRAERHYNRFWYSLGLFLPFVDLQANKLWRPQKHHAFLRNYMRVHILLGWILIPIVLAALTGIIK